MWVEPAKPTSGLVIDKGTRQPIAGAELSLAARRENGNSYLTCDVAGDPVLGVGPLTEPAAADVP